YSSTLTDQTSGRVDEYLQTNPDTLLLSQIKLQAPVTGMDKVLCIGMNYKDHCAEQNAPIPTEPVVFNKFPSCIVGPFSDIPFPPATNQLDWEVELVIVIGKSAFQVSTVVLNINSRTSEMVFNVPQIVSWVSKFFTLLPGDLILTGTPPGVGVFKNPQEFIQKAAGDTVICGIEHIGEIENKIV
ncbi:fumarylacetoacetate hydrolase domain-containing protein 2, partial [Eurytemora carolleeae]|uniref:fumarylacetoacetate hydrolase domain-containing protein 2 n=1 Tax=Eurytemora carolleeae TaxID=1294199 RepID=UPI000C782CFC